MCQCDDELMGLLKPVNQGDWQIIYDSFVDSPPVQSDGIYKAPARIIGDTQALPVRRGPVVPHVLVSPVPDSSQPIVSPPIILTTPDYPHESGSVDEFQTPDSSRGSGNLLLLLGAGIGAYFLLKRK